MLIRKIIIVLLLLACTQTGFAQQDPLSLVRQTADTVLREVVAHKAELDADPSGVYALVSSHVLPHFDFNGMTRSAMGKYWRRASEEQKLSLEQEFRQLLVRTYGVALLNYSGEEVAYLPLRTTSDENRVTVQTRVKEGNGGPEIPVDYRLIYRDEVWKVYDVVIDGISLVLNYRTSFSGQIRRNGIDGLISQLIEQNKS